MQGHIPLKAQGGGGSVFASALLWWPLVALGLWPYHSSHCLCIYVAFIPVCLSSHLFLCLLWSCHVFRALGNLVRSHLNP